MQEIPRRRDSGPFACLLCSLWKGKNNDMGLVSNTRRTWTSPEPRKPKWRNRNATELETDDRCVRGSARTWGRIGLCFSVTFLGLIGLLVSKCIQALNGDPERNGSAKTARGHSSMLK